MHVHVRWGCDWFSGSYIKPYCHCDEENYFLPCVNHRSCKPGKGRYAYNIYKNCFIARTLTPLSIKSKIFPPPWTWTSNFKRTPLSLTNYGTTSAPYKIKTKAKPSHVTLKLTTRSIVRFSPQAM